MNFDLLAFAENLKRLRVGEKMTQKQLSKKSRVHYSSICKYEADALFPSVKCAIALCRVFNVSLDYLFTDHSEEN